MPPSHHCTRRPPNIRDCEPMGGFQTPLLSKTTAAECPLLGVKRTSRFAPQMSANDPKRTWLIQEYRSGLGHLGGRRKVARSVPTMVFPVKATFFGSFPVVRFGQRTAGHLERPLFFRAERRDHVREHEIFRAGTFGHAPRSKALL